MATRLRRQRLDLRRLEERLAPALITVTTVSDNTTVDGKVSLREALTSANNNSNLNADVVAVGAYGTDDIAFDATLFSTPQTIKLLTALPTIAGDVNFKGTTAANVIVARDAAAPAIRVFNCGINLIGNVSFSNMTITGGSATTNGAGIFASDDNLTMTNCVIANNVNTGPGGGIGVGSGGGTITLTGCSISGNSATIGGGIYFFSSSTLVMDKCIVAANTASAAQGGGGIFNFSDPATIRNSTISGNHATGGSGGGITMFTTGPVTIQNCTIAFNDAKTNGGGINRTNGTLSIESSIVAKNTAPANGDDVNGTVSFAKFNLIGETDGSNGITDPSNKTGTKATPLDPLIAALADNGGPTQTHALLAGSPAINNGSNPASLPTDQRGSPTVRIADLKADIGAFENCLIVGSIADAGTDSLRQAVTFATFQPGADTITFDSTFFSSAKVILLTSGEIVIPEAMTITGPGATLATVTNSTGRAFNTSSAPTNAAITIASLTIANCKNSSASGGGAILGDDEAITLNNCVLTGNSTTAGSGGAVNIAGPFTANDCSFTNNVSTNGSSGALINTTNLGTRFTRCAITGNTALSAGGIDAAGSLDISNSTIAANKATNGRGGGIVFVGAIGSDAFTMLSCTITGNSSSLGGGGIALLYTAAGSFVVRNCTITANTAASQSGGGFFAFNAPSTFNINSSVVSGNVNASAPDIYSKSTVTANFCAIGTVTGMTTFAPDATTTSLLGANLLLGPLANNGGPTLTILPAADSPLIGQGSNPGNFTTDQRGTGFARVVGAQPDIGAVEVQNILPLVVLNANDSGNGSLRRQIADANALPGADTITFDPAFFLKSQTITLTTGEIKISDAVTIIGPGSTVVAISGNSSSRAFNCSTAPAGSAILITGVTLTGCVGAGSGGAIFGVDENITLNNCVMTGNVATGVSSVGGAVYLGGGGTLTVSNCSLSFNSSGSSGGALIVAGKLLLSASSILSNTSGGGGGILVGSYLSISDCLISGNRALSSRGGGVYFVSLGGSPSVTIVNSTISGNTSAGNGGGVYLTGTTGNLTVRNSTITSNTASSGAGGGIFQLNATGSISLESTIVSGNTNSNAADISSPGAVNVKTSAIGSFFGLSNFVDLGGNLPFGANLKLGPLGKNGGPTSSFLPALDSPLVNAGSNPAGLLNDQRGAGFGRSRSGGVDIGAVEAATPFIVTNANDSGVGSLRQAVADANAFTGADAITFDPLFFATPRTITLTTGEIAISEAVAIAGPGATLATVTGANSRAFNTQTAPAAAAIAISGLTIANCKSSSFGGAIVGENESITLTGCVLSSNSATGSGGAVIVSNAGTFTGIDCSFINNSSANNAGALGVTAVGAKAVLQRCTFSGNSANFFYGAIYARSYLLITDSTIAANAAKAGSGGGIGFYGPDVGSAISIQNCTISGNSSSISGGGIELHMGTTGTMQVQNSTITNNSAGASGGGIARIGGSVLIILESSIVSGNSNASSPDIFTSGAVAAKNCAIGSTTGITTFFNQGGNLPFGINLKLGPLADNGGTTLTHLPALDSPLVNAGSNPAALANDQRGAGFARSINGGVDIGAIEAFVLDKTPPLISSITPNVAFVSDAQLGNQGFALIVTFNEPMDQSVLPTLSFPVENPGGSLAFDSGAWINSTQFRALYDVEDLGVALNAIDVRVAGGKDLAGNVMTAATTADVFSIDTKNAIVASIVRNNPTLNNLSTVGWTVTFSEPVTGVSASNFTLFNGGLSGAPAIVSVTGGGTTWIVNVSGYAGEGTLALYVTGTAGVTDPAGNPLAALPVIGPSYSIDAIPPSVFDVRVNDGSAQRSRVTSITVTFIEVVTFAGAPSAAFTLTGPNGAVTLNADITGSTPIQTIAKLTFSGANSEFTSLKDGRYTLTVLASQITDAVGNALDGNGDTLPGDNFVEIGAPTSAHKLFRLFGDADGNGLVDGVDFGAFRSAFNTNNTAFDFDGSGIVDGLDFGQFRSRFGLMI